ncbi:MAG: DUF1822 family protein [Cyanobacteria bacterium P01_F01_bin.13]
MSFTFAASTEWWLEIPKNLQDHCWQASQSLATPDHHQAIYLNHLCLQVFLPWFQQEYAPEAAAWPSRNELLGIWTLVNGSGISLASKRLVLIPTDSMDSRSLDVPQEWVDMPAWAADYYLAIQMDLADCWLKVWGYTTHQRLKQTADFDRADRTYCVSGQGLQRDLTTFWPGYQLCPDATTQVEIAPLPTPTADQVAQAIHTVSQADTLFPRLVLPFELWGGLLSHKHWRQKLFEGRLNSVRHAELIIAVTHLSQWFQNLFTGGWQSLEAVLGATPYALRSSDISTSSTPVPPGPKCIKFITLNAESDPQTVALTMALNMESDGRTGIQVQVYPHHRDSYIPAHLVLAIYSNANEMLQTIQARDQENYIQLPRFKCWPDTQFRLQMTLSDDAFSETFAV